VSALTAGDPVEPALALRALELGETWHGADPEHVRARIAAVDARAEVIDDVALFREITALMAASEPGEEELRERYEAHRDLFGLRTFEQSRHAVNTLVRIERTREALRQRNIE
jgi:hypothetical protein